MLLAYVDESYDAEFYWIAALLVSDDFVVPLSDALAGVVEAAADSYPVSPDAELHGHDLFQAKGDWIGMREMASARAGVYLDAFSAIASVPVDVIVRGVSRLRLLERYTNPFPPHTVVLSHLLERIDERALELNDLVFVIADEIDGAAGYRQQSWEFKRSGTQGYRNRFLTQVVDTIHFAPSRSNRLVQASDLIAFTYRRRHARSGMQSRSDRALRDGWERIADRVLHEWCWYP